MGHVFSKQKNRSNKYKSNGGVMKHREPMCDYPCVDMTLDKPKVNHHMSPPPMKPVETANYIALFDYDKATKDDMTIRKNDPLLVTDQSHPDWWLAKNLRTKETGYVPFNYITAMDNLEIKEWFFPNTTRREAERLLEYLDNETGIFLIRESEQDRGNGWSLSILDYNDQKERHTKHYKIRKLDNGGCYISPRKTFSCLDELVQFYSS